MNNPSDFYCNTCGCVRYEQKGNKKICDECGDEL